VDCEIDLIAKLPSFLENTFAKTSNTASIILRPMINRNVCSHKKSFSVLKSIIVLAEFS